MLLVERVTLCRLVRPSPGSTNSITISLGQPSSGIVRRTRKADELIHSLDRMLGSILDRTRVAGDPLACVPAEVDLAKYQSVTVWCSRFNVNFATAPLTGSR